MLLVSAAALSFLIWIYLFFARGGYWRVDRSVIRHGFSSNLRVTAVIPARDEGQHIGEAVCSLLLQDMSVRVIVVDDASTDGTGELARAAVAGLGVPGSFEVITGKPLPAGWSGKLWAVSQGIEEALLEKPDYLLLTDADIVHGTGSVRDLVAQAERDGNDLTSLMVRLTCRSTAD